MSQAEVAMQRRPKVLLLDDDQDLLDLYEEIVAQLPSQPEIHTARSGARAMALLEGEPFDMLICDLKMPKMDGLQVLSVVRRKHPQLRTVVLTSLVDEQFRSRVYALGIDLFWQKPANDAEIKMFLGCLESLLEREAQGGFRGVQSKSLVDIIQLECISQNSTVLKITNGPVTGKIWIDHGEVVDAEAGELAGEAAFAKIFFWKGGGFENLPAEPNRPRRIFKPYNALLLETAQAYDEAQEAHLAPAAAEGATSAPASPLAASAKTPGVEFVLALKAGDKQAFESRGLENPERMAEWARQTLERFRSLADQLRAGPLQRVEGFGLQHNVALNASGDTDLCVGWQPALPAEEIRERMKKILALWVS